MERRIFKEQIDVAKFAMSLAINLHLDTENAKSTDTSWNVGSFDSDGDIRSLFAILFPDTETPDRLVENLVNNGLEFIGEELSKHGDIDVADLMRTNKV